MTMKGFIFAAGLGTRLKPLTDTRPKALVEYKGRPMIDFVIENLQKQGIDSFIVNIHHFGEQIINHINKRLDHSKFVISDERDLLRDTGGAIRHAYKHNLIGQGTFLVHNVDIISNLDIRKMQQAHRPESLATLLVSNRQTSRYLLFDENMRLVGWTNVTTGEIKTPYPDLNPNLCIKRAFGGIHIINARIGKLMESMEEKFPIIDFYLSVCRSEAIYGYEQEGLMLTDIGKIDSLSPRHKSKPMQTIEQA